MNGPTVPRGVARVGRLEVGPGVIGYGSCGTIVFEGVLDGRPVAVKRLLAHFHELARAELATLIASDEHPNILRCFAMEEDEDFVYVALERCECTLASLVRPEEENDPVDRFAFVHPVTKKPTPEGLRLMRDAFAGVNALHAAGVVHRDLKPQNVLVTPRGRGKIADMGLAKKLNLAEGTSFETRPAPSAPKPNSSFPAGGPGPGPGAPDARPTELHVVAGGGTAGWLAPERLSGGRQTRAVDAFGLGCLLHYCLTRGGHPFGGRYERDSNVMKGSPPELDALARVSREAADLVRNLIALDPSERPTAAEALLHPFWWSDAAKLAFLCDVSDRVEMEDREVGGGLLLRELERGALNARDDGKTRGGLGITETNWSCKLHVSLLHNLGKYRSYKADEVRDLLRVIRNKSNHFRELPVSVRKEVGAPPEGFYGYFEKKFPNLLLHVYGFVKRNCAHERAFRAYFFPRDEDAGSRGAGLLEPERLAGASEASATAAMARSAARIAELSKSRADARAAAVAAAPPVSYPERPEAPECVFYVKTGRCKFGAKCHFHHPKAIRREN
jgi:serine/threonine-protein kinase/endoribonuclease IRE1